MGISLPKLGQPQAKQVSRSPWRLGTIYTLHSLLPHFVSDKLSPWKQKLCALKQGMPQERTPDPQGVLFQGLGTLPFDGLPLGHFPNLSEIWFSCLENKNYTTSGLNIKIKLENAHDL